MANHADRECGACSSAAAFDAFQFLCRPRQCFCQHQRLASVQVKGTIEQNPPLDRPIFQLATGVVDVYWVRAACFDRPSAAFEVPEPVLMTAASLDEVPLTDPCRFGWRWDVCEFAHAAPPLEDFAFCSCSHCSRSLMS
jgi:hypothetical protein